VTDLSHTGKQHQGPWRTLLESTTEIIEAAAVRTGTVPLITFSNNIIVSPSYIELGEVSHTLELMYKIVNEGEGVSILLHDGVECSMAWSHF
jgi:hypothetical protein